MVLDIHLIQGVHPPQCRGYIIGDRYCKGSLDLLTTDSGHQVVKINILAVTCQTGDPIFLTLADVAYKKHTQAFGKNREIGARVRQNVIYRDPVG